MERKTIKEPEKPLSDFKVDPNNNLDFIRCINLIMNSIYFRRLADKTQVIISLTGPNVRTRLTHTIEVSTIARDLCIELGLNDKLAEAIALAHDIGHTPFGHVGERTLKEVMCGCDTLEDKVLFDFENSGFKHNLQSFKILFESFFDNEEYYYLIQPFFYILWGAAAHSRMSYSSLGSGVDNEILIHNGHCINLYNCHFSTTWDKQNIKLIKDCKLNSRFENQIDFKNVSPRNGGEESISIINDTEPICKPWYCAGLKDLTLSSDISINNIWATTFCYRKCYFGKIWEYRISCKKSYDNFDFLFDHPFPNCFYANLFDKVFYDSSNPFRYISLESFIVSESDEIAQRKQDLEDGLSQGLISIHGCIEKLEHIFDITQTKNKRVDDIFNQIDIVQNIFLEKSILYNVEKPAKILESSLKNIVHETPELFKYIISELEYSDLEIVENIISKKDINEYDLIKIFESFYEKIVTNGSLNKIFFEQKVEFINGLKNIKEEHLKHPITNEISESEIAKRICDEVFCLYTHSLNSNIIHNSNLFFYYPTYSIHPKEISIYNLFDLISEIDKNEIKQKYRISENIVDIEKLKNFENKSLKTINQRFEGSFTIVKKDMNEKSRQEYVLFKFYENLDYRLKRGECDQYLNRFKELIPEVPESFSVELSNCFSQGDPKIVNLLLLDKKLEEHFNNSAEFYSGKFIYINRLSLLDFEKIYEYVNSIKINNVSEIYSIWIDKFKSEANQILTNRFTLDKYSWFGNSLKDLEKFLRNTILKSEMVEKNDGKASYIIKKLFEAYLTNPHQLPDLRLLQIAKKINFERNRIESESKHKYENELDLMKDKIHYNKNMEYLKWENTKKLDDEIAKKLPKEFFELFKSKNDLLEFLDKNRSEEINEIRKYIDNTILTSLVFYNNLLTRTICDHIAGLTDRDALSEFEKLYFGVMEIA